MGKYYNYVISCKPGLTGLWQVTGRNNINFENRCKLDEYYSKHKGIWLDMKIFFKTFITVMKREGAR